MPNEPQDRSADVSVEQVGPGEGPARITPEEVVSLAGSRPPLTQSGYPWQPQTRPISSKTRTRSKNSYGTRGINNRHSRAQAVIQCRKRSYLQDRSIRLVRQTEMLTSEGAA